MFLDFIHFSDILQNLREAEVHNLIRLRLESLIPDKYLVIAADICHTVRQFVLCLGGKVLNNAFVNAHSFKPVCV